MTVYVDDCEIPYKHPYTGLKMKMSHMIADNVAELHEMADVIGVDRKHFQGEDGDRANFPHYDICQTKKRIALKNGAVAVGRRELVTKIREIRHTWQ